MKLEHGKKVVEVKGSVRLELRGLVIFINEKPAFRLSEKLKSVRVDIYGDIRCLNVEMYGRANVFGTVDKLEAGYSLNLSGVLGDVVECRDSYESYLANEVAVMDEIKYAYARDWKYPDMVNDYLPEEVIKVSDCSEQSLTCNVRLVTFHASCRGNIDTLMAWEVSVGGIVNKVIASTIYHSGSRGIVEAGRKAYVLAITREHYGRSYLKSYSETNGKATLINTAWTARKFRSKVSAMKMVELLKGLYGTKGVWYDVVLVRGY